MDIFNCLAATATLVGCMLLCRVSGLAITAETPEEALVDGIAANGTTGRSGSEDVSARVEAPKPTVDSSRGRYLTNTGYVIPMESSMRSPPISDGEISVYVAIAILTLIAVALIIAGSVFCYRYSAAMRASEGTEPIVLRSSRCPRGDDKLARHAQRAYYQRQKQNIAAAIGEKNCFSKSSIPEEDSDQDDQNVYGFQGLASTSGLEVNNPMFQGAASDEE